MFIICVKCPCNYNYNRDLLCAHYKQNDGALHCYDVLTIKAVVNKKSFEASLRVKCHYNQYFS